MKISKRVTLRVVRYNGLAGYCLSGTQTGSGDTWFYYSQAGSIQTPVGTPCPVTQTGLAGDSLSNP